MKTILNNSRFFSLHTHSVDHEKTLKAAKDFEAMTINQLLQPMFHTEDDTQNMFSGGVGEKQFRPILIEQIAKKMEQNGGIGLTHSINHQMLLMQEKK